MSDLLSELKKWACFKVPLLITWLALPTWPIHLTHNSDRTVSQYWTTVIVISFFCHKWCSGRDIFLVHESADWTRNADEISLLQKVFLKINFQYFFQWKLFGAQLIYCFCTWGRTSPSKWNAYFFQCAFKYILINDLIISIPRWTKWFCFENTVLVCKYGAIMFW